MLKLESDSAQAGASKLRPSSGVLASIDSRPDQSGAIGNQPLGHCLTDRRLADACQILHYLSALLPQTGRRRQNPRYKLTLGPCRWRHRPNDTCRFGCLYNRDTNGKPRLRQQPGFVIRFTTRTTLSNPGNFQKRLHR